ncbi:hypothetical protein Pcinc_032881 [Petrolisthes cinctipes]|uniref:DDE Tnp4 domain-containing protein n=1 Tax=Petrolisthes cinctipes TaxID=88211 RepID=A0AAE1ETD6_PETCI|nr:hypothetical protein Pcinc_032881 [Petrolisthes cinctipes]
MPSTPQQLQTSAQAFSRVSNFPRVIGAIDGTHVAIKAPSIDEAIYINRKRFHSLNVQVVCDGNGLIINYSARFPGSTHDAYIWRNCNLRHHFSRGTFGDYLLLGDSGYPLEPFLMTPVTNPTNEAEELYNRAHTVVAASTFSVSITLPLCGVFIERYGWEATFYLTSLPSLVWCLAWFTLVCDFPDQHPRISESESMYIVTKVKERGTYMAQRKGRDQKSVPWRSLITSVPLWATIIHSLGNNWCIAFFFTQLPTYMRNVLGFSIKSVSSDGSTGD